MSSNLFEDFLTNADTYRAAERYWLELVRELVSDLGEHEEDWAPYIPRVYADGVTPIATPGNPIIDRWNPKLDRAFQVIQQPSAGDGPELSAWINDYKSQRDDGVAIPSAELVISVSLSEQSAGQVRKLLRVWLDPSSELGETEALTQGTTR